MNIIDCYVKSEVMSRHFLIMLIIVMGQQIRMDTFTCEKDMWNFECFPMFHKYSWCIVSLHISHGTA